MQAPIGQKKLKKVDVLARSFFGENSANTKKYKHRSYNFILKLTFLINKKLQVKAWAAPPMPNPTKPLKIINQIKVGAIADKTPK